MITCLHSHLPSSILETLRFYNGRDIRERPIPSVRICTTSELSSLLSTTRSLVVFFSSWRFQPMWFQPTLFPGSLLPFSHRPFGQLWPWGKRKGDPQPVIRNRNYRDTLSKIIVFMRTKPSLMWRPTYFGVTLCIVCFMCTCAACHTSKAPVACN